MITTTHSRCKKSFR